MHGQVNIKFWNVIFINFHDPVYMTPPLDPILNQKNQVHSNSYLFTTHFNITPLYQLKIYKRPLSFKFLHQYTGCSRRNVPDFGRVFLMLKYTDITQNTYVQSWTVTEIMAREKCGLLAGPRTVPVSWQPYPYPSLSVVSYYGNSAHACSKMLMYFLHGDKVGHISVWHSCHV